MDTERLIPIPQKKESTPDTDFPSMGMELIRNVNIKAAVFLFLIGSLIFSDVFIESCLCDDSYTDGAGMPTSKGTFVQLLLLTFAFLVIDLLIKAKLI